MSSLVKKPVIIYAESTPNPYSMKFVANQLLVQNGGTAFTNGKSNSFAAKGAPPVSDLDRY